PPPPRACPHAGGRAARSALGGPATPAERRAASPLTAAACLVRAADRGGRTVAARELVIPATRCVCGPRGCPWRHRENARVRAGSIDPVWVVVVVGLLVAAAVFHKGLPAEVGNRKGALAPKYKPGVRPRGH